MKTKVYVDGYNLYYGLLKPTKFKWLDLYSLFNKQILPSLCPSVDLLKVKFFTAPIKAKFSKHGADSLNSQQRYHKALKYVYGHQIEIIEGNYSARDATMLAYQSPVDFEETCKVWRLEEKKTDVNIALHMYRDVVQDRCEQIVLCTNDTDLQPALSMIRNDFPHIKIGLIIPSLPKVRAGQSELIKVSDWVRHHINYEELANSQLPLKIATKKKPILKPDYW